MNEKSRVIIDNAVSAVLSGAADTVNLNQLAKALKDVPSWERDYVTFGQMVKFDEIPKFNKEWAEYLDEDVTAARLKQLKRGALPTADEIESFQNAWLAKTFTDAEDATGFELKPISDSAGRKIFALLLKTGLGLGYDDWIDGLFVTALDAMNYLWTAGEVDEMPQEYSQSQTT